MTEVPFEMTEVPFEMTEASFEMTEASFQMKYSFTKKRKRPSIVLSEEVDDTPLDERDLLFLNEILNGPITASQ